jgi:dihydropyrimidinase
MYLDRRNMLQLMLLGSSAGISGCRKPSENPGAQLLIRGGRIVGEDRMWEADIRVAGEKISEIGTDLPSASGREQIIEARGLNILPGGIDPHAHLTQPWVDDYTSGSRAAFAGGITTIGSMVPVQQQESLLQALQRETERVHSESMADIVLHPILSRPRESTPEELSELVGAGFRSLKIFMVTGSFVSHEPEYRSIIREAGRLGILTLLHCEDRGLLDRAVQQLRSQGKTALRYYPESRPVEAEVTATSRAVEICEYAGKAPVYIVHLSSRDALQVCRSAKDRDLPVFVETRPLYLYFTKDRYLDPDGPLYVGQPPLRDREDLEALWNGMADGSVDTIGTDHAPWTRAQKMDGELNISRLRPGVADLQTMLPVLYSRGVLENRITLGRFVSVTSTNAAKLMGLYPQKGTIAIGSDADLTLWDPEESRVVRQRDLYSNADFSLFEGMQITSWPRMTIRRGEVVYQEGRILASAGSGTVPHCGPLSFP